jgi:hypothetical protein
MLTCTSSHIAYFILVLRIRDVYPGSRVLIFVHPGFRIPDLGQFTKNFELSTQKTVIQLTKGWVSDPRSGIRNPRSGIRKKPIPDPQHCFIS